MVLVGSMVLVAVVIDLELLNMLIFSDINRSVV